MNMIDFFRNLTNTLWGSYGFQALFYFSLVIILILEKRRLRQIGTWGYSLCILLIIYNPLMYLFCQYIFGAHDLTAYYCRLFCLVPIVFVIAYAMILVLQRTSGWKKFLCTFLMILIVAASGHSPYGEEWFIRASNSNKVPDDVIQISALFPEEEDSISIMVPSDLTVYMRQIDSRFHMPYGRGEFTEISNQLLGETQDVAAILNFAVSRETDYIVTSYTEDILAQYRNLGCEVVGFTNRYVVLRQHCPKWILTQYSDDTGSQAMFYTLQNFLNGSLIIIDGGWAGNANQVRNVILENGGIVDAWVLTHYHPDHIGAFNTIYQDPQGITINHVYTTPYDADLFRSVAQEWDGIDTFCTFVDNIANGGVIHYITRDSVVKLSDMKLTFFNCWDPILENVSPGDILNNSSLVFKAETSETSVLFCGNAHGDIMSDFLMKQYGTELKADYVQLGHHGNNSLTTDFYDLVTPEAILFDAPEWLMTGTDYDARILVEYFQEQGIPYYDYRSAPNRFLLY